jgi:metallophosphoesterase superfamily enzyme
MQIRPRLTPEEYQVILDYRKKNPAQERNVLVIGDLHEPFTRKGYLQFCIEIYNKYKCNEVVFIGDLIDNHFSSFHDTDPDGHSAGEELDMAKKNISKWYDAFPQAKVCIGNHDAIPYRKGFNSGISKKWIKSIGDVLETPNWQFAEEWDIDDVLYCHGTGRSAEKRMRHDLTSVVQGHYHSVSYLKYAVGRLDVLFAMQIGCGVYDKSYAMAYGRHFDKMHINCGIVLNDGKLPLIEYMPL